MAPVMSPQPSYVKAPLPLDKRIAIALYKMVSCAEYRVVGNQFGVHKEATAIARNFEARCHLPQLFGAIDGTHIPRTALKKG